MPKAKFKGQLTRGKKKQNKKNPIATNRVKSLTSKELQQIKVTKRQAARRRLNRGYERACHRK